MTSNAYDAGEPDDISHLIGYLLDARDTKRAADATDKALTEQIKVYMQGTGEVEIWDGEHGVSAILQERQSSGTLDLARMARDCPELLLALAEAGVLRVSLRDIDSSAPAQSSGNLIPFLVPGDTSYALIVKAAKK